MTCNLCLPATCYCSPSPNSPVARSQSNVLPSTAGSKILDIIRSTPGTSTSSSKSNSVTQSTFTNPFTPGSSRTVDGGNIMAWIGGLSPSAGQSPQRYNNQSFHMRGDHHNGRLPSFVGPDSYSIDPFTGGKVRPFASQVIHANTTVADVTPSFIQTLVNFDNQQAIRTRRHVMEDDEAGGLGPFDQLLYTCLEGPRRASNPAYAAACRETVDLTISMPVQVPYGTICVDANSGEQFYGVKADKKIKEAATAPHSDHVLFGRGMSKRDTYSYTHGLGGNKKLEGVPDHTCSSTPSACDVWSSFLRVKLGTIYNVNKAQMGIVVDSLKKAFVTTYLSGPVHFVASGIYCEGRDGKCVSSPPSEGENVKYYTCLKPTSPVDLKNMYQIRSKLKRFAKMLQQHFGGQKSDNGVMSTMMRVELDANCSSIRLKEGLVRLHIRENYYCCNLAPSLKERLWVKTGNGYHNETTSSVFSKVETMEIRLEHTRGRMVDPRWPKELVIGRKLASNPQSVADVDLARVELTANYKPINIVYRGKYVDPEDQDVCDDNKVLSGEVVRESLLTSKFSKEIAAHLRLEPQAGKGQNASVAPRSPTCAPLPRHDKPARSASVGYNQFTPKKKGNNKYNQNKSITRSNTTFNSDAVEFSPTPTFKMSAANAPLSFKPIVTPNKSTK